MKKHLLLLLFSLFSIFSLYAQSLLEKEYNAFRSGDRLIKQQVEYKSSGDAGKDVFWDFSQQQLIDDAYELYYFSLDNDTTVIGREHRTLYKYKLSGDSLFCLGYENPTTRMDYLRPELLLVFPSGYESRSGDYFYGRGEYSQQLQLTVQGTVVTHADASGTLLLPGGETLNNVLRVHSVKRMVEEVEFRRFFRQVKPVSIVVYADSIDYHLASDSILMEVETYRWFAEGYRYPVFETLQSTVYKHGQSAESFNTAFFYTPEEQYYSLKNDSENVRKRERLRNEEWEKKRERKTKNNFQGKEGNSENSSISYTVIMTEDGKSLLLDYLLTDNTKIGIMLFDVQGRLLKKYPEKGQEAGSYQIRISMEEYDRGEYLLRIVMGNEVIGEKILKH